MKNNPMLLWFDYCIWAMLQIKFMSPAAMIARNDKMEEYMKMYSLNGIKIPTICKQ